MTPPWCRGGSSKLFRAPQRPPTSVCSGTGPATSASAETAVEEAALLGALDPGATGAASAAAAAAGASCCCCCCCCCSGSEAGGLASAAAGAGAGRALLLVLEPGLRRRSVPAAAHRRHRPSEKLRAPAGASSSRWGHLCGWSHAWREGRAVWTSSGGVAAVHSRRSIDVFLEKKNAGEMFFLRRHLSDLHTFFLDFLLSLLSSLLAPKK